MTATRIGCARCCDGRQELTARRSALPDPGVAQDRIYLNRGPAGTTRIAEDRASAVVGASQTAGTPKPNRLSEQFGVCRATAYPVSERAEV